MLRNGLLGFVNQTACRRGTRGWSWYQKAVAAKDIEPEPPAPFPSAEAGQKRFVKCWKCWKCVGSVVLFAVFLHDRPLAYFDITVDEESSGRIEIELANDIVSTFLRSFEAYGRLAQSYKLNCHCLTHRSQLQWSISLGCAKVKRIHFLSFGMYTDNLRRHW